MCENLIGIRHSKDVQMTQTSLLSSVHFQKGPPGPPGPPIGPGCGRGHGKGKGKGHLMQPPSITLHELGGSASLCMCV